MDSPKSKAKFGPSSPPTGSGSARLKALPGALNLHLPTPLTQLSPIAVQPSQGELWLKNDGLSGAPYGGNKLRKLQQILAALPGHCTDVVTFGAAGSHHVLATAIYAQALGLRVTALMLPQAHTPHAERMLLCSIAQGVRVVPVGRIGSIAALLSSNKSAWIGPGAIGPLGSWGYALAVPELQAQLQQGGIAVPKRIVVAVGSGGTAAGLLVGLVRSGLDSELLGVLSAPNRFARPLILAQALRLARTRGVTCSWAELSARLVLDHTQAAGGYGVPSAAGEQAAQLGLGLGLQLDPTYTAKAFAVALAQTQRTAGNTLYWHTLSAQPLEPLLAQAPSLGDLPRPIAALLRPLTSP